MLVAQLKAAWAALRSRSGRDKFRPHYGGERLIDLVGWFAPAGEQGLLQAVTAWKAGERESAARSIVEHFQERAVPRFFLDARAVIAHPSSRDARLAGWMHRAGAAMREATERGLPVYAEPFAPLRPGFPWAGRSQDGLLIRVFPHRFAFAPRLALAGCTGDVAVDDFRLLLRDWMRFARDEPELPFCSSLVVLQRLLACSWAFAFLAAASAESVECRFDLLQIIGQDVEYLLPRLGKAHPNNHLLADRFADWYIATLYPELRAPANLAALEETWTRELLRQTYDDGGSFEHSVHYHALAVEMACAYLLLARANGRSPAGAVASRIGSMLRLQADLCGPDGNAPDIGDRTDDPLFPLDDGSGGESAALREICRALYAPDLAPVAAGHPGVERAFWLLGGTLAPSTGDVGISRLRDYPQSGLLIFPEAAGSTRCVLRTGPAAGTDTMAGHMHADLMSIYLVHDGVPVLVDAGTYTYRHGSTRRAPGRTDWREYFSGPMAHNAVVIDGQDPLGKVKDDFREGSAQALVRQRNVIDGPAVSWGEAGAIAPDGYSGLVRGVVHVHGEYFLVYSAAGRAGSGSDVMLPLQFDAGASIREEEGCALEIAGPEKGGIRLVYSDGLLLKERRHGSIAPPGGWVSRVYGQRTAATQLLFQPSPGTLVSAFVLGTNRARKPGRARCSVAGAGLAFQVEGAGFCDYILVNPDPAQEMVSCFGIDFTGRLLWLRKAPGARAQTRALGGVSCRAPEVGLDLNFQ